MKAEKLAADVVKQRVKVMIDDFLELDPDHRGEYIEALTDLLCTRSHLYPERRARYRRDHARPTTDPFR